MSKVDYDYLESQSKQSLLRADIHSKHLGSFVKNDFLSIISIGQGNSSAGASSNEENNAKAGAMLDKEEEENSKSIKGGSRLKNRVGSLSNISARSNRHNRDRSLSYFGIKNKEK